jgi:diacylglycerol kinase (ATP)
LLLGLHRAECWQQNEAATDVTTESQAETQKFVPRPATQLPSGARTVLISMNPRAGSRSRHEHVAEIKACLEAGGFEVLMTTDLEALHELATTGQKSGKLRVVLAIGGDGTASVVRNHVPLEVPLLHVPMGTENLLGRFLGQLVRAEAIRRTVEDGVVVSLDLGKAGQKMFLLMISAGFDAEVIRALHEGRKGNISRTAYILPILNAIRGYTYPPMRLYSETDDATASPRLCRWLFAFNLPLYALGLPIAPDAVATDGLLDLCTFERGTVWSIARYLWHVTRKIHHMLPDAALSRIGRFRLEPTTSASVAYQIDGDYGGTLPVDVEVLPGQLRLLVSPETARRLGFTTPT